MASVNFSVAQKRRKPPVVRAEVTVKGNFPPLREKPNEEDEGIWHEYKSAKFGFEAVFPAESEDVFDDSVDDLRFFQAYTRKAMYGVIVKPVSKIVSQNEISNLYDNLFEVMLNSETTKIISRKNVRIGDLAGREIIFEKGNSRTFSRMFVVANKLYIASMNIDKKDYKMSFDKWALKFLESVNFPLNIKSEG